MTVKRWAVPLGAALAVLAAGCDPDPSGGPEGTPAAELRANNDDPRIDEADALLRRREFEAARALVVGVLEEFPGSGRAELVLGMGFYDQKKHALAAPHFERALELEPFSGREDAWFFLGWCRYYLGELEGARAAADEFAAARPDSSNGLFLQGVVAIEEGREAEAEAKLKRAAELLFEQFQSGDRAQQVSLLGPLANCYVKLADLAIGLEDWTTARDHLERSVAVNPGMYQAWYKLSLVWNRIGNEDMAAQALAQYEAFRPKGDPNAPEGGR